MTQTVDGTTCDRCGADLGNGSLVECTVTATLDAEQNVVNLHHGLDHRCGCARKLLAPRVVEHYRQAQEDQPARLSLYVRPDVE